MILKELIKISCFKCSGNIQKKEYRPDRSVSNNQFSSVTMNELAMESRQKYRPIVISFRVSARQPNQ